MSCCRQAASELHALREDLSRAQAEHARLAARHDERGRLLGAAAVCAGLMEMDGAFAVLPAQACALLRADHGKLFVVDRDQGVLWSQDPGAASPAAGSNGSAASSPTRHTRPSTSGSARTRPTCPP